MDECQQTRADPGEAWRQTMQGFTNPQPSLSVHTMQWQQDLVRLWVDTQQRLADFWMRNQQEKARHT